MYHDVNNPSPRDIFLAWVEKIEELHNCIISGFWQKKPNLGPLGVKVAEKSRTFIVK